MMSNLNWIRSKEKQPCYKSPGADLLLLILLLLLFKKFKTMKTTTKIFATVAFAMGFTFAVNAQSSVTQAITANATVQTQLVVTQVQPLEFGTVDNVVAQTKTVSVLGVATSSGGAAGQTGVQQGIGKIVRTGNAIITYKLSAVPTNLAGPTSSLLPIGSFVTSYSSTQVGTQTAGNATVGTDTQVAGTGTDIFVHIGATVTPDATTTATGTHTGEITLSAEYN